MGEESDPDLLTIPQWFMDQLPPVQPIDAEYVTGKFQTVCQRLGVADSIYVAYRWMTGNVHPCWESSIAYLEPDEVGERMALTLEPRSGDASPDIAFMAHCLVWAGRAIDDLIVGRPRRRKLRTRAEELRIRPLPAPNKQ